MVSVPRPRLLAAAALGAAGLAIGHRALSRRPEAEGYPPLDVPKPIADDVWVVDGAPITAAGLSLPVRMTIIRLAGGELLLHSPIRHSPQLASAIAALGRVRHLVAPGVGHWTFLPDWQRAHPDATVWAVPGLAERAPVKASGLRIDAELGPEPPPTWADSIVQGVVRGAGGFAETWLLHRPSNTLLLTDLVQNLDPAKLPPVTALLMRAAGATQATTPRYLRLALRLGGDESRAAIRRLAALRPERVVIAHGAWFAQDGAERLAGGLAWLA